MFEQLAQHGRCLVPVGVTFAEMVDQQAGAMARAGAPGLSQSAQMADHSVHQVLLRGLQIGLHDEHSSYRVGAARSVRFR